MVYPHFVYTCFVCLDKMGSRRMGVGKMSVAEIYIYNEISKAQNPAPSAV
jgi:hypothetical protein